MKRNLNRRQSREAIESRQDFCNSTGSLRGVSTSVPRIYLDESWLNDEEKARYTEDFHKGILYTVISYDTPIAWFVKDQGWYRVSQKFSQTTSCHTGMVPVR